MGRKILSVVVALIVSFGIMMIVEMVNTLVVMPPSAEIMEDSVRLRDFMAHVPPLGYVIVLIGYFLASFAGGFIVTKMSRQVSQGITLPVIVGTILTLGMIGNIFMLPGQPIWFIIIGLLMFVPVTLFGHRLAR
ncbi:MAG: hypothetical protein WBC19_04555 [Pyrinomonadaceae bacterium]|nr:hypothetical protein [Pyrinomonadaceae bacterium]